MKKNLSKLFWVSVAQCFVSTAFAQCNMLIDRDTVMNMRGTDTSIYVHQYNYNASDQLVSLTYFSKGSTSAEGSDTIYYNKSTGLVDSVVRFGPNHFLTGAKRAFTYTSSGLISTVSKTEFDSASVPSTRQTNYYYNQSDELRKIVEIDPRSSSDTPDSLTTFEVYQGNIATALVYIKGQTVGIPIQFEYTKELSREYAFLSDDFLDYLNNNYVITAYPIAAPNDKFMEKTYTFDANGLLKTRVDVYGDGEETETRHRYWKCGNLITDVVDDQLNQAVVSPNPSTDGMVNVHLTAASKLSIYTSTGTLVYAQEHAAGDVMVSTDMVQKGVYIFKVQNGVSNTIERVLVK
jgi:hypothetical protein